MGGLQCNSVGWAFAKPAMCICRASARNEWLKGHALSFRMAEARALLGRGMVGGGGVAQDCGGG